MSHQLQEARRAEVSGLVCSYIPSFRVSLALQAYQPYPYVGPVLWDTVVLQTQVDPAITPGGPPHMSEGLFRSCRQGM